MHANGVAQLYHRHGTPRQPAGGVQPDGRLPEGWRLDGSFAYVTGPDTAGHNPDDYLGGVGPTSSWWYIFQGSHSTTGGYIDTLNFFLKHNTATDISTLRVGSISTIHGALGDHGQNYKTLSVLLKALGGSATIFHGCAG